MWWIRLRTALAIVVALAIFHPVHAAAVEAPKQLIYVTAASDDATRGWLRAYERAGNGDWVATTKPIRTWFGSGGLVDGKNRRQGTGTTPTGQYSLVSAFGRSPNPGTSMRYRQFDRNDAWTYNPRFPSTYNVFQTVDRRWQSYGRYVEHLWSYGRQYDYVAVLDFNLPEGPITRGRNGVRRTAVPANTQLGGGIFLHVSNGKPTAGCIAINRREMEDLLQWLDPRRDPHIVIEVRANPLAHPNIR